MLVIISYHTVLPLDVMNNPDVAVASAVAERYLGKSGVVFFAVAVTVSVLGNTMCALLATSRYLQAAGAQGVLPGIFGLINKRFRTPLFALAYMVTNDVLISNLYGSQLRHRPTQVNNQ
eukprot:sb/3476269/